MCCRFIFLLLTLFSVNFPNTQAMVVSKMRPTPVFPGAYQFDDYLPKLKDKKVGLVVNHTSMIGSTHLVDTLITLGVNVKKVFSPEHGFKGMADAGEHVGNQQTNQYSIISLYGDHRKPQAQDLQGIDILVFDLQDVGVRFYTYISTLHYVMESAAEQDIPVIVLDRPNPNGHYVDGPVTEDQFKSFVGMHNIPIVYGMTLGELAMMINGEHWLAEGVQCDLTVIPCNNYTHNTFYELPVKPSPNLPNIRSVLLYPSICLFEGTTFSLGRGTEKQFQVIGHPALKDEAFHFTPISREGAKNPPHKDSLCFGMDLTYLPPRKIFEERQINLGYLLNYYKKLPSQFFQKRDWIEKLTGTAEFRKQVMNGWTAAEIKKSWQAGIQTFKVRRKQYLLYPDFE